MQSNLRMTDSVPVTALFHITCIVQIIIMKHGSGGKCLAIDAQMQKLGKSVTAHGNMSAVMKCCMPLMLRILLKETDPRVLLQLRHGKRKFIVQWKHLAFCKAEFAV